MSVNTFEFVDIEDWCQPVANAADLLTRPRSWAPVFPARRVRLPPPDWSPSAALSDAFLACVSPNLTLPLTGEVEVSGSRVANLGAAVVRDSSLLVLVRDGLAITEGYGDRRWADFQLNTWPRHHNHHLSVVGLDEPPLGWQMRVKAYSIAEGDLASFDRPCLYLSVRHDDRNIYHWMFETMARLRCLELIPELRRLPLLVRDPPSDLQIAFLRWLGISQEIVITGGRSVRVPELIFCSIPTPPALHPDLLSWLRDVVLRAVPAPLGQTRRRLYISRRDGANGRRVANEAEVAARLARHGFEVLVMSELAPADQIRAFQQAEIVVLPHGGAGSHMLFTPPDCRLIEVHSPTMVNPLFYAISKTIQRRYGFLIGTAAAGSDFTVDPDQLEAMVITAMA